MTGHSGYAIIEKIGYKGISDRTCKKGVTGFISTVLNNGKRGQVGYTPHMRNNSERNDLMNHNEPSERTGEKALPQGQNVAYIRVSTADQNDERQRAALKRYSIDEYFSEKVSAKDANRPQLQAMLQYVRKGDTVYVHDFSRLARSTADLLTIVKKLQDKGVRLVSLKENLDTTTPTGKLLLTMIAAINEFERENLLERQREGIALAKQRGVYKGRRKIQLSDYPDFNALYSEYMSRKISKAEFARRLKLSRKTLDRLLSEYRTEH